MHFDLVDLRLFIHIAESPSLTQGARKACMSAAAASARIKHLEESFANRLLYRDSRGVELTPSGKLFLQHARVIMRHLYFWGLGASSGGRAVCRPRCMAQV